LASVSFYYDTSLSCDVGHPEADRTQFRTVVIFQRTRVSSA